MKWEWYLINQLLPNLHVLVQSQWVKCVQNSVISIVDFEQENTGWVQVSRKIRKITNGMPYYFTHPRSKVSKNWFTTDKVEIS